MAISLLFALISSFLILFHEYRQEKNRVVHSANQLAEAILPQLSKSSWDFDHKSVSILLKSLNDSESILQADILEIDSFPEISENKTGLPVFYREEFLGYLIVQYDFSILVDKVKNQFKVIAYVVFSMLILIGLFLYAIVNRTIIRHIEKIKNYAKNYQPDYIVQYEPLSLNRQNNNDEIGQLVQSINQGKKHSLELLEANREYSESIEQQLNYDFLTGLPNRRSLEKYLERQATNYDIADGSLAILFIDLDDFRLVNDNVGHALGDEVLKVCADKIIRVMFPLNGYVVRLGGDEFIACVYVAGETDAKNIAKKILSEFEKKIVYGNFSYQLGCSIGISLFPEHKGEESNQLIQNADHAKSRAKELGKNTFFIFNNEMMDRLAIERKIKSKIKDAYENECFELNFQPLVDVIDHKIVGFEALIRWKDEELGWVRPDIFIEIAERMGLMFDIDTWVFQNAIKQVSQWREKYHQDFILSVNFSPTNFYHARFIEDVKNKWFGDECLKWVELEVTERLMLNNDDTVIQGLNLIRDHGIKFSIDDFGIGYSSMGYINADSNSKCII